MSLNQLTLDQRKPWLNIRAENVDVDGEIIIMGDNVVTFLPTLVVPDGVTTYTTQLGYVCQYGKMIHIVGRLAGNSTTAGAHPFTIATGLSFQSLNTTVLQPGICTKHAAAPVLQSNTTGLYLQADQNSSNVTLYEGRGTSSGGSVVNIPTGGTPFDISFSCTIFAR